MNNKFEVNFLQFGSNAYGSVWLVTYFLGIFANVYFDISC